MLEEDDLGQIYGAQMRYFNDPMAVTTCLTDGVCQSIDQLQKVLNTLETNPDDRRMVVSYWNPLALAYQALPACHLSWIVNVVDGKINLSYYMRSCDFLIGNNLNSYGLLLHLLSIHSGYEAGVLTGFFHDTHIYEDQVGVAEELAVRGSYELPTIETDLSYGGDILQWDHTKSKIKNYKSHAGVKINIAV